MLPFLLLLLHALSHLPRRGGAVLSAVHGVLVVVVEARTLPHYPYRTPPIVPGVCGGRLLRHQGMRCGRLW